MKYGGKKMAINDFSTEEDHEIDDKSVFIPVNQIIFFVILSYALLWIPFLGSVFFKEEGFWINILGIMGPYSPLLAALITRTIVAREGFEDAQLGVKNIPKQYWLCAILLPFFWNGIQDVILVSLDFIEIDWNLIIMGLYRVPINLFGGIIIFIGEEFGWRSYLLQKLRPLERWQALLLTGIIWSVWHLPLLIFPNLYYGTQLEPIGALMALFIFVLTGFIFGWLYLESNSVWPCALMHSFNNLIHLGLFDLAIHQEPTLLQSSLIAIGSILFVWFVLYWRGCFYGEERK
jgi:membrane protease YdiL (CAAX protease family)